MAENTTDEMALIRAMMVEEEAAPEANAEQETAPQDEPDTDEAADETDAPQDAEADEEDGEDENVEAEAEAEADTDESGDDDDDEEDDDEDNEDDPEQLYTVKVDGEERQVTLDELQRGYSGQAYIQKGMNEVAEQKKALTEAVQSFQQEQQRFVEFAQRVQREGFKAPPQEPDPEMRKTDPLGYNEAMWDYQRAVQEYQAEQQQIQRYQQHQQEAQQAAFKQHLMQQDAALREQIPEYSRDPEGFAKRVTDGMQKYYGLPPEALPQIMALGANVMRAFIDGLERQELRDGTAKAKKKRTQKSATKPKGKTRPNPARQSRQALQRAKETQSDAAWLEYFKSG